jgi:serpin B
VALSPSGDVARAQPASDAPNEDLAGGFNDAGFGLLRTQSLSDNLVLSPVSIGHALLMARAAADDATGESIDSAFSLPEAMSAHDAWNASDQMIAGDADRDEELTVSIADRIWPRIDLDPDQEWIDLLASHHGASTEALDFSSDPEGSRDTINSWVSDQTEDLIPELVPEGFIKPGTTILVLTDAIYFKAQWETVFGKYSNIEDVFTRLDGSTVTTEYMRELELADRRGAGDGFVGAEIPYVGGDFSMLVVIPDDGRFEEVRQRLDQDLLDEVDATFTAGPYELLIPKWETTTQLDLLEWLTDLGAAPGLYPGISPAAFLGGAVHGADIAARRQSRPALLLPHQTPTHRPRHLYRSSHRPDQLATATIPHGRSGAASDKGGTATELVIGCGHPSGAQLIEPALLRPGPRSCKTWLDQRTSRHRDD